MKTLRPNKIRLGFLLLALLLLSFSPVGALEPVKVTIDGTELNFDVPPAIIQGRTLVPLRMIFESLGANVAWDPQTATVTGLRDNTVIKLQVDNINASKNSEFILLDVPAAIVSGRTMVPARFIAESLGADVVWHEESRTVEIRSHLPYNLTEYHILESHIRQLTAGVDESFYQEFAAHIRTKFAPDNFVLQENYLRQYYKPVTAENGTYTGPPGGSGQGIFESGGYKYVGDWYKSQMHGQGAYYFPDGGYYTGEWKNNGREGWGVLSNSRGDEYVGEWKNDKMWGKGVYTWADGQEYLGEWYGDSKGGLGIYVWPNGQTYSGEFLQGQIFGRGIYIFEDGEKYIGEHTEGIMNGKGKYYWNSGLVFSGEFIKGDRGFGTYQDQQGKLLNVKERVGQIIEQLVKPQMTDQEKVKALHDYIVLNTTYDKSYYDKLSLNRESHTAYGVLEKRLAVCDGYAETLQYLLTLSDLESMIVKGEALGDRGWEGHAWLIVKINGTYRHLDATWDDPDTGSTVLNNYFLVTDETMAKDHKWNKEVYPACP